MFTLMSVSAGPSHWYRRGRLASLQRHRLLLPVDRESDAADYELYRRGFRWLGCPVPTVLLLSEVWRDVLVRRAAFERGNRQGVGDPEHQY